MPHTQLFSWELHTPIARALDRESEDPDQVHRLPHWAFWGLYVPICEVGLSLTSLRYCEEDSGEAFGPHGRIRAARMSLFGKVGEEKWDSALSSHHCWPLWLKSLASEARARVAARERKGPEAAPELPSLLGTWQSGFLAALTLFWPGSCLVRSSRLAWAAGPTPGAGWGPRGAPGCLIFSTLSRVGLQTWIVCVRLFQHDQMQSLEPEQSLGSMRRDWRFAGAWTLSITRQPQS